MVRIGLVYTFGSLKKEVKYLGGAERRINYIFSHINSPNIEVSLLFVLGQNKDSVMKLISNYLDDNANIIVFSSYFQLFIYLLKQHFDFVCYTDCVIQTVPAIWGATIAGSKKMMLIESTNRAYRVFHKGFRERLIMDMNFKMSNYLDTLYPSSKSLLVHHYGKNRKISITPCTLPKLEKYSVNIQKDNLILFAGRLINEKNPELFIRSAISCSDFIREKGFKCLVCGDGPLKEALQQIVDTAECNDIIIFSGYINMEEVTPKCRVFCSLQESENYPSQSLLEAIASGCYCICTNYGDTKLLIQKEFGELINEKEDLSSALCNVIDFSDEEWIKTESAAKTFAFTHFDVQKAIDHYSRIFLENN